MKAKTILLATCFSFLLLLPMHSQHLSGPEERQYWIQTLTQIVDPVLTNLSRNTLRANMPVEVAKGAESRNHGRFAHLEVFGRTMTGLAPWLELGVDDTEEGQLRKHYIDLSICALKNGVDPASPDYLNFTEENQPLVDAAFLAHALLRAPTQLWGNLDEETRGRLVYELQQTRCIKPFVSNWLLFSAIVEAALLEFTGDCDIAPIRFAIDKHVEWYKGDAWYGDGPNFHYDYYNSFVIQPMLLDIARVLKNKGLDKESFYEVVSTRFARHAEQQERMISPEGTFPPVGRSLVYRFGAFQVLSQTALMKQLPKHIIPAQVRSALTTVIRRQISQEGTFDKNGWLQLGFCGHQPELGETYITTGSLYLCSVAFLPLGLPVDDPFWSEGFTEWTAMKAWSGKKVRIDKALKGDKWPKRDIYLLIGQSNMAGRGYLTEEYRDTIDGAWLLTPDGKMEPASNPLNKYSSIRKDMKYQQVGPGYSFARKMVEVTGRSVCLVVNAKGGSSINSWMKGAPDDFYGEAVRRVKQAQQWGEVKAILWHQGESDRKDLEYMKKLSQLVSDLRGDLKNDKLPFIAGEIAHWGGEWASRFNEMIRNIGDSIPHSTYVSAEGLTPLIDEKDPHFSALAQVILGKRYAERVLMMEGR